MAKGRHDGELWLRQAADDFRFARLAVERKFFAQASFIAQQVGEKAAKAVHYHLGARPVIGQSVHALLRRLNARAALTQPLARAYMTRALATDERSQAASYDVVRRTFDRIADMLGDGRHYLLGNRMSAADLDVRRARRADDRARRAPVSGPRRACVGGGADGMARVPGASGRRVRAAPVRRTPPALSARGPAPHTHRMDRV